MAVNATITISGLAVGDEVSETFAIQLTNTNSPAEKALIPLVAGRNDVFFPGPPTFQFVVIIPPSGSAVTKTWDASSTIGGPLGTATASLITVPVGTTTHISASGTEVCKGYFW